MFLKKFILSVFLLLGSCVIAMEVPDAEMGQSKMRIASTSAEWEFLFNVAMNNYIAVINSLMWGNIDPNTLTAHCGSTAFQIALKKDFPLVIRALIDKGKVEFNQEDLAKAIVFGSHNVAEQLIRLGVDLNAFSDWSSGQTALTYMLYYGCENEEILNLIPLAIEYGAEIEFADGRNETPYQVAKAMMEKRTKVNKILLSLLTIKKQSATIKDGCTICLELLESDITTTRCNHKFHKACLSQWITTMQNCPNCRQGI